MKISACLIVHNEEYCIRRCLSSLVGVVDEILVFYDGPCTDITLDIAKDEFGAKVESLDFYGAMEKHQSYVFSQASGDWILAIDADEFLSDDLKNSLRDLVSNHSVSAYSFIWPLWDGKRQLTTSWPRKTSLFRKDKIEFLGVVHYRAKINGLVQNTNYVLSHRPEYNNFTCKVFKTKWNKWAKIQAKEFKQDFSLVPKFNYTGDDWPKIIKLRKRIPLVMMVSDFFWTLIKTIWQGRGNGIIVFKVAFMQASYKSLVDYYLI